eukprot:1180431-Prorocentrum_minimum.AAC.2
MAKRSGRTTLDRCACHSPVVKLVLPCSILASLQPDCPLSAAVTCFSWRTRTATQCSSSPMRTSTRSSPASCCTPAARRASRRYAPNPSHVGDFSLTWGEFPFRDPRSCPGGGVLRRRSKASRRKHEAMKSHIVGVNSHLPGVNLLLAGGLEGGARHADDGGGGLQAMRPIALVGARHVPTSPSSDTSRLKWRRAATKRTQGTNRGGMEGQIG